MMLFCHSVMLKTMMFLTNLIGVVEEVGVKLLLCSSELGIVAITSLGCSSTGGSFGSGLGSN